MILVTGATGQLARLVIEHLLKSVPPNHIVAAVRNPEKAEDLKSRGITVREADYDQPEQWPSALEGVEKVLLISGPDVGGRVKQHKAVIDAIKQTESVKLVAYTSILRADTTQVSYAREDRETEKMIRALGIPFVFLRHGWYIENYTMNAEYALKEGVIYGCAGTGRISGASRADYAEAAATVLTSTAELKEIYELAGDMSFTLQDVALDMSWQTGKTVAYLDMSEEEYRTLLIDFGLPEGLASTLAIADTGVANGDVYSESRDLSNLIGRSTTYLSAVVEEALSQIGHEGTPGC